MSDALNVEMSTRLELTDEERAELVKILLRKAAFGFGFIDGRHQWHIADEAEDFKAFVEQVIIDTELILNNKNLLHSD